MSQKLQYAPLKWCFSVSKNDVFLFQEMMFFCGMSFVLICWLSVPESARGVLASPFCLSVCLSAHGSCPDYNSKTVSCSKFKLGRDVPWGVKLCNVMVGHICDLWPWPCDIWPEYLVGVVSLQLLTAGKSDLAGMFPGGSSWAMSFSDLCLTFDLDPVIFDLNI